MPNGNRHAPKLTVSPNVPLTYCRCHTLRGYSARIEDTESATNHLKAASRLLKIGSSRREKPFISSRNSRGRLSVPIKADFLTYGLSNTAVSLIDMSACLSNDAPAK